MIPPNASLVKYDNPVLVSRNTDKKTPRAKALKASPTPPTAAGPLPVPPKGKGTPMDAKAAQQTDEILNSILPPREWTESGQLWVQQVSSTPATRLDVVNLQEELDRRLQQRQARETGICPVRRELYSQCFDELIRQVTINCAERGLLLLRVRDEIRMTIAAYQTLYESSVAFGMRKALQAEQGKADMEKKITELESEKRDLERQVNELKAKCEQTEKRAAELRQVEEKKHTEEIQFLKRTNQQLKESLLKAQKKLDAARRNHCTQEVTASDGEAEGEEDVWVDGGEVDDADEIFSRGSSRLQSSKCGSRSRAATAVEDEDDDDVGKDKKRTSFRE